MTEELTNAADIFKLTNTAADFMASISKSNVLHDMLEQKNQINGKFHEFEQLRKEHFDNLPVRL